MGCVVSKDGQGDSTSLASHHLPTKLRCSDLYKEMTPKDFFFLNLTLYGRQMVTSFPESNVPAVILGEESQASDTLSWETRKLSYIS